MVESKQAYLDSILSRAVNLCCDNVGSELVAVILYGSYSKGEGLILDYGSGSHSLYNDVDLVLVVERYISVERLVNLETKLKHELKLKWVDLSQKKLKELNSLRSSVFNYDLIHGGRVLYGDVNLLKSCKRINRNEIPLIESEVLFITRMWSFFGVYEHLTEGNQNSYFVMYQMAKTLLAIPDAWLIVHGDYQMLYRDKVEQYLSKYNEDKTLVDLLLWALKFKTEDSNIEQPFDNCRALFDATYSLYRRHMLMILGVKYGTNLVSARGLLGLKLITLEGIVGYLRASLKKGFILTYNNHLVIQKKLRAFDFYYSQINRDFVNKDIDFWKSELGLKKITFKAVANHVKLL